MTAAIIGIIWLTDSIERATIFKLLRLLNLSLCGTLYSKETHIFSTTPLPVFA